MTATSTADVIWVEGPDAAAFLHGLLSNDIERLAIGTTTSALLLDATGHIRVMLRVHRTEGDAFTLVTDGAHGSPLADALDEYHFSEDVEIIGPEQVRLTTVDDPAGIAGAELVIAGTVPGTFDAIGDAVVHAAGARGPLTRDELDALRVAAGVPTFGIDIGPRTLVHEAGLQRTAVSFAKGCYLGQETVARVEHRGGVRRRLVGLRLPAAATAAGREVVRDGRPVGTVTSVAEHPALGPIALGMVRTEAAAGDRVLIVGVDEHATIVELPFPPGWGSSAAGAPTTG